MASGCGLSSSGALNGCYKSVRHDRLVAIWVRLFERERERELIVSRR